MRGVVGTNKLSPLQLRVAKLVNQGMKNAEIAAVIGTSDHVIKNYMRVIFDKLGFDNRVEVALWYESHHGGQ